MTATVEKLRGNEIDFSQLLYNIPDDEDGQDQVIVGPGNQSLTLLAVCKQALISDLPGEQQSPPNQTDKKRRGDLARFISRNKKSCKLKAESVTLIKTCVAKLWPPLIVSVAFPLLDPSDVASNDF